MPGPFDYARGRGDFAGVGKFGSLAGVDLRAELATRLGVPGEQVRFLNDAVAYGLGEWAATAERPRRFVCVTLGTGVGSAWLADGEPVDTGPEVPPHGWAHLLTSGGRPLEDTVSTRAIRADFFRRTGVDADVRTIAAAVRDGEEAAGAAWGHALRALGAALGSMVENLRCAAARRGWRHVPFVGRPGGAVGRGHPIRRGRRPGPGPVDPPGQRPAGRRRSLAQPAGRRAVPRTDALTVASR